MSITDTLTGPLSFPYYIGAGFVGGALGFYLVQKYKNQTDISIVDSLTLESGIAGAAATYIGAMLGADPTSMWKGALIGFGGEWVFNKFLKGMYATA